MMLSPPIDDRSHTRHSCWLAAGSPQVRASLPDWPALVTPLLSRHLQFARSPLHPHPCFEENRSGRLLWSNPLNPHLPAKSP